MKKVIILFAVILTFAANSFAQTGAQTDNQAAPTEPKMEKRKAGKSKGEKKAMAKSMKKELGLTSEQEMRMKDISATARGKMKAIQSDNTLDKNQKRAQMVEIRKAQDAEIQGVMNADQYTKFKEMRKSMAKNKAKSKGHGKGKKSSENAPAPKSN